MRGGTGKPATTNERKGRDAKLLEVLGALLKSLRADGPGEPKLPNREQPASGNRGQQKTQKGRNKQRRQEARQEVGLLNALERLMTKAKKEPEGVLQRLEGSLEAAKRGRIDRRSTVDRDEQETEMKEEPAQTRAECPRFKNIGRGRSKGDEQRTRADCDPTEGDDACHEVTGRRMAKGCGCLSFQTEACPGGGGTQQCTSPVGATGCRV